MLLTVWSLLDPGILGVLLSLAFGLLSVYFYFRGNTYPGQIDYYKQYEVGLLDPSAPRIPGLAITYQGNPIDHNLVILRAGFVNSGRCDLDPRHADLPLTISCPADCQWMSARILGRSGGVRCDATIEDNHSLVFRFDSLFRRSEAILFEAILSKPTEATNRTTVSTVIAHRISNTNAVRRRGHLDIPSEDRLFRRENVRAMVPPLLTFFASWFAVLFSIGFGLVYWGGVGREQLGFNVDDSFVSKLELKRTPDNSMEIRGKGYSKTVSFGQITALVSSLPPLQTRTLTWIDAIKTGTAIGFVGLGVWALLLLVGGTIEIVGRYFQRRRIRPFMFTS